MGSYQERFSHLKWSFFPGIPALLGFPLLLALISLFGPIVWKGQALFWGTPLLQFIPWWHFAWKTVLSGHLPLWNPLLGMGAPLLANYQTALFYPPNWSYFLLYLIGGSERMAWGQAWLVALHLAWTAAGMAFLGRRLGLPAFGQAVSGLALGLCGYLVARAGFLSINAAASWLPWILAFLTPAQGKERSEQRYGLAYWLSADFFKLTLCLMMLLLAGHAQTAWYTLLLAGLWSGYLALIGWPERSFGRQFSSSIKTVFLTWSGFGAALLLACGLAAVQLLPTLEYLAQSQRAEAVSFQLAMTYSFWPWRLLGLLAPGLFGNPALGDYWGYANFWEDAIYIGMLPFLLALGVVLRWFWTGLASLFDRMKSRFKVGSQTRVEIGFTTGSQTPASLTGFCVGLFAVALFWGLGQNTPIFPWLYRHVPTFDLFQAPTRIMIWAEFSLALLAGIGAARWHRPEGRALYWTRLGSAGAFAVALGAGLAWLLSGQAKGSGDLGLRPSFIRATALAGFWGLGAGLLSLAAPSFQDIGQSLRVRLWQYGVMAFIALDLAVAGLGLNPGAELKLFLPRSDTLVNQAGLADQRIYLSPSDEYDLKYKRFLRFDSFDAGEPWLNLRRLALANTNLFDGIALVNNFDPLVPGHYAAWLEELPRLTPEGQQRRLQFMGVGGIMQVEPTEPLGVLVRPLAGSARVHWVPCAVQAFSPQQAWAFLGNLNWDREVILEVTEPLLTEVQENRWCMEEGDGVSPELALQDLSPNHLVIRIKNGRPGFLVLADTWYPGWQAWVDGHRVPLWRANTAFRLVWLPSGASQVEFSYRPLSFYGGAALSGICWVVLLALASQQRRRCPAGRHQSIQLGMEHG